MFLEMPVHLGCLCFKRLILRLIIIHMVCLYILATSSLGNWPEQLLLLPWT
jgi:hypothetical protein